MENKENTSTKEQPITVETSLVKITAKDLETYHRHVELGRWNIVLNYIRIVKQNMCLTEDQLKTMLDIAEDYINGKYDCSLNESPKELFKIIEEILSIKENKNE